MGSLKFSDSSSKSGKRKRLLLHILNVCIVTFIYVLLVHKIGNEFGIDVDKPLREYDMRTVLTGLVLMVFSLAVLYGISFKILKWIFFKLKI